MLLLGEQDFAASNHDSFDANSLVMVTLRQATSRVISLLLSDLVANSVSLSALSFTRTICITIRLFSSEIASALRANSRSVNSLPVISPRVSSIVCIRQIGRAHV